jgi:glycyl-tRNA synthetase beta chain
MVGEFPELQGIMGYHYAINKGENQDIARAIKFQYSRVDETLPTISAAVILADNFDLLIGLFGINKHPTGDKDPFALRRAALVIVSILLALPLDLAELLLVAVQNYEQMDLHLPNADVLSQVRDYIIERYKNLVILGGVSELAQRGDIFNAVNALHINNLADFNLRMYAVATFIQLPESPSLIAANKRVVNILSKNNSYSYGNEGINESLFQEVAEKNLYHAMVEKQNEMVSFLEEQNYSRVLTGLAALQQPIDAFFESVMVMAEEPAIKQNRLLLLQNLRGLFMSVADLSQLS